MNAPSFSTNKNTAFSKSLKSRVNNYFKTNNLSKNANSSMVAKTVLMLCLFFGPLIAINTGLISSVWLLFALYIISGLGMSGIGMGIMHDAIHGSYSKDKKLNNALGLTFNLIGANASVWKIQHNVLHHTYPNVNGADDDINPPFFLRFSPNTKWHWTHKFQFIYVWFFYSISTILWVTAKDFVRITRYKNMGFIDKKSEYKKELVSIAGWKILYFTYALILPLIIVPLSWWIILLAFISMHLVTGFLVSTVFQIAHIIPDADFPIPNDENKIEGDWYRHQLLTTSNFSPGSKIFSWLIGGLNYQVEHHLFPNICHVHYRNISKIVENTAREHGIPYHVKKTFVGAIWDHIKMLKMLGNKKVTFSRT